MVKANHALSNSALIGKSTMAFFTGQSLHVLKSRYTDGGLEHGFRRCFANLTSVLFRLWHSLGSTYIKKTSYSRFNLEKLTYLPKACQLSGQWTSKQCKSMTILCILDYHFQWQEILHRIDIILSSTHKRFTNSHG